MLAGCAVSGGGAVEVAVAAGDGDCTGDPLGDANAGADGDAEGDGEASGVGDASCAGAEPAVAATNASVKKAARLRDLFVTNDIGGDGFVNRTARAQVLQVCQRFDQCEAALAEG